MSRFDNFDDFLMDIPDINVLMDLPGEDKAAEQMPSASTSDSQQLHRRKFKNICKREFLMGPRRRRSRVSSFLRHGTMNGK
jgi:hypothetical protein